MTYFVYIVRCADNSLYCGQTNNIERRIKEHQAGGSRGARYVKTRRPVTLVYTEKYLTLREALLRERQIKSWTKKRKEAVILKGAHQVD